MRPGRDASFSMPKANITTRDAALNPVIGFYSTGEIVISRLLGVDNITVLRFLAAQASLVDWRREHAAARSICVTMMATKPWLSTAAKATVTVRRNVDGTLRDAMTFEGATATLRIGSEDNEGDIFVRDSAGRDALHLDGDKAAMFIGAEGNEGDLIVRDSEGRQVVHLGGDKAVVDVGAEGNEGDVRVFDADGDLRIHLDGASGNVNLLGADCAEDFTVRDAAAIEPGSVLVIDDCGELRESTAAYDRRVAGVVSGGGGFRTWHPARQAARASAIACRSRSWARSIARSMPIPARSLSAICSRPRSPAAMP